MTFPIQKILDNATSLYGNYREVICIHTDLFPNYPGTQHPFVSREWNGYAHGNTCFGSFPIEELILKGKLMESLIHMRSWASSYDVHRTSPINNARRTYYSLENHEGVLSNDSNACSGALDYYTSTIAEPTEIIESHLGQFCVDCICKNECSVKDRMNTLLSQRKPLEDLTLLEDFVAKEWCNIFPEGPAIKAQQSEILGMLNTFRAYMPSRLTRVSMKDAAKSLFGDLGHTRELHSSEDIVNVLHNLYVTDAMGRCIRASGNLEYKHTMCVEDDVIVEDMQNGDTIIEILSIYSRCLNVAYLISLLIVTGKVKPQILSGLSDQHSLTDLHSILIESCKTNAYIGKDKIELPFPDMERN
jgi:hypothetical protein